MGSHQNGLSGFDGRVPMFPFRSAGGGRRFRLGFTLIEMLVAVAIIGVLVVLLVPSLNRARTRSQRASCGAQLRQVNTMLSAYAGDNRGRMLSAENPQELQWTNQLEAQGYVSENERPSLRCPFYHPYEDESWWNVPQWKQWTYGARSSQGGSDPISIQLSSIPDPQKYWILGDSVEVIGGGAGRQYFSLPVSAEGVLAGSGIHLRHGGEVNLAFADGRVQSMDSSSLYELGFRTGRDLALDTVTFR